MKEGIGSFDVDANELVVELEKLEEKLNQMENILKIKKRRERNTKNVSGLQFHVEQIGKEKISFG